MCGRRFVTASAGWRAHWSVPHSTHLLDAADLVDIGLDIFGNEQVFTWWNRRSDFYETDRGWRLDHLLASPGVASLVDAVTVDRAELGGPGSTDHAPLTITPDYDSCVNALQSYATFTLFHCIYRSRLLVLETWR